jgi:hypothetical protein
MAILLVAMLSTGCDSDLPTGAEDGPDFTAPSLKVVQNDRVDWIWPPVLNTCTGEYMIIEGKMHLLVKETYDANGRVHFKWQANPMGMKATTASGMVCQVNGPFHDNWNFLPTGDDLFTWPQTYTKTVQWLWICPGPHNDGKAFYKFHVTVDANGQAHAFAETLRSECVEPDAIPS